MAISTYKVFLMIKNTVRDEYEKLLDIKEFPDLGGDPELIDVTTTSNPMQINIMGILSNDGLAFTANYDKTDFQTVKNLEGVQNDFAIWFGGEDTPEGVPVPTGEDGQFSFTGDIRTHVTGGGVNEAVDMNLMIASSTPIAFSLPE